MKKYNFCCILNPRTHYKIVKTDKISQLPPDDFYRFLVFRDPFFIFAGNNKCYETLHTTPKQRGGLPRITPNCGRALTPEATILDNFCFSLHNMQFLEERPAELRQEIFDLLFETANIATFAPEDKIKYEYAMTTERDIRNQIRYAEKHGREEGREEGLEQKAVEIARKMLEKKKEMAEIVEFTGLTEEQIRAL